MSFLKIARERQIQSRTTRAYIIALTLVAVMSLMTFFVIEKVISSQKSNGATINISGRQRMLSQRISLYLEYFTQGLAKKDEVNKLIDLFEKSHKQLAHEDSILGEPIKEVEKIYFDSPFMLDHDMNNYVFTARSILHSPENQENIKTIRGLQETILPKLDLVVKANQIDAEKKIKRLESLHRAILFFTLTLLLCEAFFIFRPMVNYITRLLQEAIEARESAIKATDAKSAFLATVTHEIRTPITGVLGLTEQLLESQLVDKTKSQIQTVKRLSESLILLVNDILDYSKIEAGKLKLEVIDFSLHSLVEDTITLFSSSAQLKNIRLSFSQDSDIPQTFSGDPTRLRQILTNYIGNAIKFTQEGGEIKLIIEKVKTLDDSIVLRFSVKDSGVGIRQEAIPHLFNRFAQADSAVTRTHGGTGLGLAICKNIAEAMGGKVGVESSYGHGSTFWAEIPLTVSDNIIRAESTGPQKSINLQNKTVLIAEDNDINRKILVKQLEAMGMKPYEANNGEQAVQSCQRQSFDLILLDVEMPILDGLSAAKKIREIPHCLKTPIIALTGHSSDEMKAEVTQSGMNDFVTKPIPKEELGVIVKRWMQENEATYERA